MSKRRASRPRPSPLPGGSVLVTLGAVVAAGALGCGPRKIPPPPQVPPQPYNEREPEEPAVTPARAQPPEVAPDNPAPMIPVRHGDSRKADPCAGGEFRVAPPARISPFDRRK